jgi:DNA-nicking Smr family endonuclease
MARLLADVVPLRGPARVAPSPSRESQPRPYTPPASPPARPTFVLERGHEELWGHRADVGRGALDALWSEGWAPQHRIDLHGETLRTLGPLLAREVRALARRGIRRLLLIHGKGRHSRGGEGVLAEAVVEILTEGPPASHVRAFRTAPGRLGGRGALAVELDGGGGRRV